jgi:hypothetical protein
LSFQETHCCIRLQVSFDLIQELRINGSVFGKQSNGWQGNLPQGEGQGNREMESRCLAQWLCQVFCLIRLCVLFFGGIVVSMISVEILREVLRPEVVIKRLIFRKSWKRVLADWVAFFNPNLCFPSDDAIGT